MIRATWNTTDGENQFIQTCSYLSIFRVNDVTIFRVVAGEHDLSQVSGLEQNRDVSGILVHADYNKKSSANDIALIYVITKF